MQLQQRRFQALLCVRVDHVHNGFRRRQVHFAVEKGSLGEFARFRRPKSQRTERAKNALHGLHAAVTVDFRHILAGIAFRRRKEHGHTVVYEAPILGNVYMAERPRLTRRVAVHQLGDAPCQRAGHAYHRNRSTDRRTRRINCIFRHLCPPFRPIFRPVILRIRPRKMNKAAAYMRRLSLYFVIS
jgi:glutathionyl-hydroquinone reductase